jgi:hypothetical protein
LYVWLIPSEIWSNWRRFDALEAQMGQILRICGLSKSPLGSLLKLSRGEVLSMDRSIGATPFVRAKLKIQHFRLLVLANCPTYIHI